MSFYTKLIELLKTDRRFVDDDGELVLAAVQDAERRRKAKAPAGRVAG